MREEDGITEKKRNNQKKKVSNPSWLPSPLDQLQEKCIYWQIDETEKHHSK